EVGELVLRTTQWQMTEYCSRRRSARAGTDVRITIGTTNGTVAPTRTANESLATTLSAPGRWPAPKICGGRGSIRTTSGPISRTNGNRVRVAAGAPLLFTSRTLG